MSTGKQICQGSRCRQSAGRVQAQDCDSSTSLRSKKPRLFPHLSPWAPLPYPCNNSNISSSWHKCLQTVKTFCVKDSSGVERKEKGSVWVKKRDYPSSTQVQSTKRSSGSTERAVISTAVICSLLEISHQKGPACAPPLHPASQSLTWFLPMVLFFAPAFLLARIWLLQRNSRESASISWDAGAERYGQLQCLSRTHHSMQVFRTQENIGQKGGKQQRNKKQRWKSSRTDAQD